MSEPVDLLADVFPGTEDAPMPIARRPCPTLGLRGLYPSPADPRWEADMTFTADGHLLWIGNIRPRGAEEGG